MGRDTAAKAPASVITIDKTDAKIGRSMKKWENIALAEACDLATT